MSIATEITRLRNAKAALKESIEAKGVTVEDDAKLDEYPALVDTIPQGGGGVEEKDVNFYDYNGTCVYSYTKDEFLALNEMPANPDHTNEGLISEGWNWDYNDAIDYVSKYGFLVIGQYYNTIDNKTKIYVDIKEGFQTPIVGLAVNGSVNIDWGDGSSEILSGTSISTVVFTNNHNYLLPGKYIISIELLNGEANLRTQNSAYGTALLTNANNSSYKNIAYQSSIYKVQIAKNFMFGYGTFDNCINLKTITIPKNIIVQDSYECIIDDCSSLKCFLLPETTFDNNIGTKCYSLEILILSKTYKSRQVFQYFYNLKYICYPETLDYVSVIYNNTGIPVKFKKVIIPERVNTIQNLSNAYNLQEIILPSTITSISLSNTFSLDKLYCKAITPPTGSLGSLYANNIYVPAESVEAYKGATNWSALADKIYPIPTE